MYEPYVALVDDDEDDIYFLKQSFEKHQSILIKTFKHGQAFLDYLKISNGDLPCLLVTDLNSCEMSGSDLIREIRSQAIYKQVPIIAYTTQATPFEKALCASQQIEILKKPNTIKDWDQIALVMLDHCEKKFKLKSNAG